MAALEYKDRIQLIADHLAGISLEDISKKYDISPAQVEQLSMTSPVTRTEIEKVHFDIRVAKEQEQIFLLKDKIHKYLCRAFDEGMEDENKIYNISKVKDILSEIDKEQRLNNNEATERTENKNLNTNVDVNVAEIIKGLKTPEEKLKFLRNQMEGYEKH